MTKDLKIVDSLNISNLIIFNDDVYIRNGNDVNNSERKESGLKKDAEQKIAVIKNFYNGNDTYDEQLDITKIDMVFSLPDVNRRKSYLKNILENVSGKCSSNLYENLVKLALYVRYCANSGILYKKDVQEVWNKQLEKSRRSSQVLKRALRFHFIAANCNGSYWRDCKVAPSFWEEISDKKWELPWNKRNTNRYEYNYEDQGGSTRAMQILELIMKLKKESENISKLMNNYFLEEQQKMKKESQGLQLKESDNQLRTELRRSMLENQTVIVYIHYFSYFY
ncbi:hypothetical protein RhiirA4_464065 [Rhizophagus irregularis]|uniref:Uncharacterized protein n=1 Tax=Rhizophagus irregularis TaxID=588596 RepID=A0A2I1GPB4_9GLOM|nr:hypothetical protein RhiirA4_464065 [Rhizophagus irregularis]